jgi:hypothetical protein
MQEGYECHLGARPGDTTKCIVIVDEMSMFNAGRLLEGAEY